MIMNKKLPMTRKGLLIMLAGAAVMAAGFIIMSGGQSSDPQVFDYSIFNFRRLVVAPLVILSGIIMIVAAIMGSFKED